MELGQKNKGGKGMNGSNAQTGSSLSDIVSFFDTQSGNADVAGALLDAGVWFKIAMFLIVTIGAIAMAIWIARIAIDILLIVTRGIEIGGKDLGSSAVGKWGTGKDGAASSVADYLKGNLLEIILVIVLIAFLITGWLFRLISLALTGFGMLANKLFNLDIDGGFNKADADAYVDNIKMLRPSQQKAEYDNALGGMKSQVEVLYGYAKDGLDSKDPKFQKAERLYATYFSKADVVANTITTSSNSLGSLNLTEDYFQQHLSKKSGLCNPEFIDSDVDYVLTAYGASGCDD